MCAASLLKGLKHSNIVTLHDIIYTKTALTFVFEYLVRSLNYSICGPLAAGAGLENIHGLLRAD